jgi:hypothetical protein
LGLKNAEKILPVYKPILTYLQGLKLKKSIEVAYNVINQNNTKKKNDYTLHSPVKIISVGRHIKKKYMNRLVEAVAEIPNCELTLVGDGDLYEELKKYVEELNISDRVHFILSMENDELVNQLSEYDIFASHSDYAEISKTVLEAMLVGLPIVTTKRLGLPVEELGEAGVLLVENTKDGFKEAILNLVRDHKYRKEYGEKLYHYAHEHWSPSKTEANYVRIYTEVINKYKDKRVAAVLFFPIYGLWVKHIFGNKIFAHVNKYLNQRINPRNEDYMKKTADCFLGDNIDFIKEEDITTPKLQNYNNIFLLWPDSIGQGWLSTEYKIAANMNKDTELRVLNGRKRIFSLEDKRYFKYLTLRLIEIFKIGEVVFILFFSLLSPFYVVKDLLRKRL